MDACKCLLDGSMKPVTTPNIIRAQEYIHKKKGM